MGISQWPLLQRHLMKLKKKNGYVILSVLETTKFGIVITLITDNCINSVKIKYKNIRIILCENIFYVDVYLTVFAFYYFYESHATEEIVSNCIFFLTGLNYLFIP